MARSQADGSSASRVIPAGRNVPAALGTANTTTHGGPATPALVLLDRIMAAFWNHPLLFGLLAALAALSGVWGFVTFYGPQYKAVPWYLWPFVPDSPLAVSAWLVAALAIKLGWDAQPGASGQWWAFFANWAAVWNAKVGLWTAFVLLHYAEVFFQPPLQRQLFQALLWLAHFGMLGLALLLFRKMRALSAVGYVGVLAVVFLWDFMDYFLVPLFMPETAIQVFPHGIPAAAERLRTTAFVAISLSFLATLALALGMRARGAPSPR